MCGCVAFPVKTNERRHIDVMTDHWFNIIFQHVFSSPSANSQKLEEGKIMADEYGKPQVKLFSVSHIH